MKFYKSEPKSYTRSEGNTYHKGYIICVRLESYEWVHTFKFQAIGVL